ncbi:cysteine-rich receptor-like protein kinase 6 isoform X2 [Carex rostrata]
MKLPHLVLPLVPILFFFFFLLFASPAAEAADALYQNCGKTGNYTTNSTYESNLQTLFTDLTKSSTNSTTNFGFAKSSVGSTPNLVSGLVLCRGDVNSSDCSSCLNHATQDIQNICPYDKEATIYYDYCLLRYSNQNFLSSTNNSNTHIMYNTQNVSVSFTLFDNRVDYLMNSTANYAAFNDSKKFGTSQMNSTDSFPVIMGLVQCTPDMSGTDCNSCLQNLINPMPKYFIGKQGGRVIGVRCNIRYEIYSFYSGAALLTVRAPAAPAPAPAPAQMFYAGKKKTSTGTILAITIPLVLIAFVVIAGLCVCFIKRRKSGLTKPLLNVGNPEEIKSVESLLLDLSVLRVATIDFAEQNKLGEGGFGAVYKGVLPDGREIAVKRLSQSSSQGMGELKNELLLVAKLQHKNLVRLLGVCLEGQEKLLVYEYVANKSLDQILFDSEKRHLLDWGKRYKIVCGIAKGLLYLHEDSQLRIIHRDLKASNILLDADMNPKISDFGLARLFGGDQTQEITNRVVGTFGYMAPEYAMRGHFSIKSDVFSYGVLVLEIITGKKNSGTFENDETEDLLSFVWQHWTNGTITVVADPSLGQRYSRSELLRCTQIALLCVQDNSANRPSMSTVAVMLGSETVSLETPSKPAFCIAKSSIRAGSFSSGFINIGGNTDRSSTKSVPMSPNEVSITDIEPR